MLIIVEAQRSIYWGSFYLSIFSSEEKGFYPLQAHFKATYEAIRFSFFLQASKAFCSVRRNSHYQPPLNFFSKLSGSLHSLCTIHCFVTPVPIGYTLAHPRTSMLVNEYAYQRSVMFSSQISVTAFTWFNQILSAKRTVY